MAMIVTNNDFINLSILEMERAKQVQIDEKILMGGRSAGKMAEFNEAMSVMEAKQKEADEYFKKEYGSMKTRVNIPAKKDKQKQKNKRKAARASKRKNR